MLNSVTANRLLNTTSSNGFYPVITKPTPVSSKSASFLGNIFTNISYKGIAGIFVTDISNHFPIFVNVYNFSLKDEAREVRNKSKSSVITVFQLFQAKSENNPNIVHNVFIEELQLIYDNILYQISKKKGRSKRYPSITTDNLILSKEKKNCTLLKNPSVCMKRIEISSIIYLEIQRKTTIT